MEVVSSPWDGGMERIRFKKGFMEEMVFQPSFINEFVFQAGDKTNKEGGINMQLKTA